MDAILDQARTIYEGEIDFAGQRVTDFLYISMLTGTGIIAFVIGFVNQNILHTVYLGLGGTVLTFLVCAPPWPWYNEEPEKWLPARVPKGREAMLQGVNVQGLKVG